MPLNASPAVLRAGDLLNVLAMSPTQAFTVTELARRVALPRSTCDSLLLGLAERGLVRRNGDRSYALGAACLILGDAARKANPGLRAAGDQAEQLARDIGAVVLVTIREGDQTRVAAVYDHGPPFGIRPRPGDSLRLVPPFGASFVAWDESPAIRAWLDRAEPPLTPAEVKRYAAALDAVRQRGYSITVPPGRGDLADALEHLVGDKAQTDTREIRDEAIRTLTHSDYLTAEIDPEGITRLTQISAPVPPPIPGEVTVSIMLLGPSYDIAGADIAAWGRRVADAALQASRDTTISH